MAKVIVSSKWVLSEYSLRVLRLGNFLPSTVTKVLQMLTVFQACLMWQCDVAVKVVLL